MNLFQRAAHSCFRKPVKSLLLLCVVWAISLLLLSGMASRSANIAAKDTTRQAIGAGFLLESNPQNRSQRLEQASQKILELYEDGQGSYDGVHQEKRVVNGLEQWFSWTDNSFESLKLEDIEKIAAARGISDYNITTVPTAAAPGNFTRIQDPDTDQTYDVQGVALIGNLQMALDSNVLSGNVSIIEGRMVEKDDENVCVISQELAQQNNLKTGDTLTFAPVQASEPLQEARIIGIYQVKEKMTPYMSGDTYRSENVIFTDLHFPEKVQQEDPLYEKAYFKVENVDEYDAVREAINAVDIDWSRYDLIDNNGNLDTMASNFNDLEKISNILLLVVAGISFIILFLIFIFWIRNRNHEIGIFLSLGISKGKILLQILCEAFMISILAVALSLIFAPAVSSAAATYLAGQQQQTAELQAQTDAASVATEYEAPQLTITSVDVTITPAMISADILGTGALILISTCTAGIGILRKNPKQILNEMS